MKSLFILTICFSTVFIMHSCISVKPVSSQSPANNLSYNVDFLFEYDGCKVYRFWDHGEFVYFTNCRGETISHPNDSTIVKNSTNIKLPVN